MNNRKRPAIPPYVPQSVNDDPDLEELPPYAPLDPAYPERDPVAADESTLMIAREEARVPDISPPTAQEAETWRTLADAVNEAVGNTRYAARIEILDAYQFDGRLAEAPDWVDKNWLSWADADNFGHEAGPALDVVSLGASVGTARRGDWVVRQTTTRDDRTVVHDHLAIISRDEFSRLYMPVPPTTPKEIE